MDNFNEDKLKGFIKNKDFVKANNYIKNSLLLTEEDSIKYLHEFINKNNININNGNIRVKDNDIGLRKLISQIIMNAILFILMLVVFLVFLLNYKAYENFAVLIIIFALVLIIGVYLTLLLLDIIMKKSELTSGLFELFKTNSLFFSNYIVKFENGKNIIVSRQIYFKLKGYSSCSIERYKYSKILKNIEYKEI